MNPPDSGAPRPRMRRALMVWLAVLGWVAVIGLGLAWALHARFVAWGEMPVRVVIDGREMINGVDFGSLGIGHAIGVGFGLMLALLVLPGVLGLGLLLGLGLPLMVVSAVLLALALPAALLLLPLWWLLRWLFRGPGAKR
jgi:hypothetical protein